jgi:hypothetical protein
MSDFSQLYRQAIEASLTAFTQCGDDVACIGYFIREYGECQMCGHAPIKWHYVLENLRQKSVLIVGSECVENYQIILEEWGYSPRHIVFPTFMKRVAGWILEKNPMAVVFDDGIVMRFSADCETLIKAQGASESIEKYECVKRKTIEGRQRVVVTNKHGIDFLLDAEPGEIPF